MTDFTLLPKEAAQNGFIQGRRQDNCCNDRDYCGDFARVHQDINGNSRSLHGGQADIVKDIGDNSRYVGDRIGDSTQSIKSDICGSTRDVLREVSADGKETRATSERNSFETRNRVEQNAHEIRQDVSDSGYRNTQSTEKFGFQALDSLDRMGKENAGYHADAMLEAQKAHCDTQKIVQDKSAQIKEQEAVHATEIKMLQENARIELLRQADTNRLVLERQASDFHGDAKLQASENTCKLDKSVELSKLEIKMQAAELYAKSELLSTKQHCDLQKQLADCCCDLKELVREKHSDTQMMFKQQENERLREQLAQVQRENLECKIQPFPYAQCVSLRNCCDHTSGNGGFTPPGQS